MFVFNRVNKVTHPYTHTHPCYSLSLRSLLIAEHLPRDDVAHNLIRPLQYLVHADVAEVPLDGVVLQVPVPEGEEKEEKAG